MFSAPLAFATPQATPFGHESIAVAASRLAAQRTGHDRAISGGQVAVMLAAAAALWLLTTTGAGAAFADALSIGSVHPMNHTVMGALNVDHLIGLVGTALR